VLFAVAAAVALRDEGGVHAVHGRGTVADQPGEAGVPGAGCRVSASSREVSIRVMPG
jgi:hypothetical protein